jgi:hypothetical protein
MKKTFANHFGGASQQISDGGYIVVGNIWNKNDMLITKTCLMKTDAEGNEIWYREFGTNK